MQPFDLTGRVAVVTGGNGGIGLGMAEGLAAAGAVVMVAGREAGKNAAAVEKLQAAGGRAASVQVTVEDEASVEAMVRATLDRFGRLDVMIANAGINRRKRPELYSAAEFREIVDINLNGAFLCAKAAYPAMKRQGRGKIIVTGSMTSLFGLPFAAAYGASKGGIMQLARALATSWAADNIQVNAILPGFIDTELTQQARRDVDGLHDRVVGRTPAGRWGRPEDFAGIAVFLASPASDFVTGTAIPVDGGYSILGS